MTSSSCTQDSSAAPSAPCHFIGGAEDYSRLQHALEAKASFSALTQTCHDFRLVPTLKGLVVENPGQITSLAQDLFGRFVQAFFRRISAGKLIKRFFHGILFRNRSDEATLRIEQIVRYAIANTLELYIRRVLHQIISSGSPEVRGASVRQFEFLIWGALDQVVDRSVPTLVAQSLGVPVFQRYHTKVGRMNIRGAESALTDGASKDSYDACAIAA